MQAILNGNKKGFVMLEVLVGSAIIVVAFVTLLGIAAQIMKFSYNIKIATQANFMLKQEMESLRSYRDATVWADAGGLGTVLKGESNPYHIDEDAGTTPHKWTLATETATTDGFLRSIVFDQVFRDVSGNIAGSGTLDSDTVKITIAVSKYGQAYSIYTYLTNWKR